MQRKLDGMSGDLRSGSPKDDWMMVDTSGTAAEKSSSLTLILTHMLVKHVFVALPCDSSLGGQARHGSPFSGTL